MSEQLKALSEVQEHGGKKAAAPIYGCIWAYRASLARPALVDDCAL